MATAKASRKEEQEEEERYFSDWDAAPKKSGKRAVGEDAEIEDEADALVRPKLSAQDMRLEKIVEFPTWREMLLDLVAANQLDPWNIDIVQVTSAYIERIKKLEMLDLRVPANLILAAAILIRFKSDALRFEEETQVSTEETYVPEEGGEPETIPMLELKTRIPPKRMVTLDELLLAMEKVFDDQKKREEKAQKIEIPAVINIQLPEFNIEQRMDDVYQRVLANKDVEGLTTFSAILRSRDALEIITTLLPVLHLAQDRKLSVFQEKFFGEIFIRVREANAKKAPLRADEGGEDKEDGGSEEEEAEIAAAGEDAGEDEADEGKKSPKAGARRR